MSHWNRISWHKIQNGGWQAGSARMDCGSRVVAAKDTSSWRKAQWELDRAALQISNALYFSVLKMRKIPQTRYADFITGLRRMSTQPHDTVHKWCWKKISLWTDKWPTERTDHLTVCPPCSTCKSWAEQQKESCCELRWALVQGVFICRNEMGQKIYALSPPPIITKLWWWGWLCHHIHVYVISGLSGFLPFPLVTGVLLQPLNRSFAPS